ncbi:hypothetical protein DPMN_164213 [Dreissena polymorpha]|uniref:Uncharacterized protein n=1 Tax=Dreissena polymorpha TaxID=45954 RepID=A0A9D4IS52_DREPO|nr:hypothetical protein DPMN_164213 [Dreissena polymorpha]
MFSEINKEPLVIVITGSQGISPISLSNGSEIIDSQLDLFDSYAQDTPNSKLQPTVNPATQ